MTKNIYHLRSTEEAVTDIDADAAEPSMSGTVAGKVNINYQQQVISLKFKLNAHITYTLNFIFI